MFKDRKSSSSPSKLKNTVSKHLITNGEEPKTSNIKKYKKKNFFAIIRQKLNSVLENKNKDTLNNKQKKSKPYRSKSFEALSNSFEEADCYERVSVSEDSIYDRNKRGSRRSQSLRSKQAVCPVELGTSQNTSGSSRTELQSNSEGNHISNPHIDAEDKSESHNYVASDFNDSSFKSANSSNQIQCSSNQLEDIEVLKPECKKENETPCHSVNSCKDTLKQKFLPSTSVQLKEKNINLKDLGVARAQYLAINAGECKSLVKEIKELSKYGWYWGPLNRCEAEEKLADQLDGAFLVRDSSDVKYLLSLSFRSYGKTLHTRIEHSNGWFSFYPQPQPDHDSYRSLVDLINHCMSESDGGVFCYSRPLIKGSPSFPVRLTKPVSRFMQVRSLQYLCRFVIRQYTSINHIQNLPIPPKIQGYLQESYY